MMISFSTWGRGPGSKLSGRVRADGIRSAADLVARRLERETGLRVCGGPRSEGHEIKKGKLVAFHYVVTLGRRLRTGGYSPEAEVWFAVPSPDLEGS